MSPLQTYHSLSCRRSSTPHQIQPWLEVGVVVGVNLRVVGVKVGVVAGAEVRSSRSRNTSSSRSESKISRSSSRSGSKE